MPQTSPAGGLSLILHIIINLIVYVYKKIVKFFHISNDNIVSNSFSKLTNKEGDTAFRKLLAYSFIGFTLLAMGTNFVFITIRVVEIGKEKANAVKNMGINTFTPNPVEAVTQTSTTTENPTEKSDSTTTPSKFKNIEKALISLEKNEDINLVDFMRNIGIVDTSFESRAELALELGVVKNSSDYSGSAGQNEQIINKLKEELNKHLVNQNSQ